MCIQNNRQDGLPILHAALVSCSTRCRFPSRSPSPSSPAFAALAADERLLEAAWLSLRIALGAATLATLLGGLVGWVLARQRAFRGRALFGALAGAPLVLPEVVTGLSLLLTFVALQGLLGWPTERGATTVLLAHATLGAACNSCSIFKCSSHGFALL